MINVESSHLDEQIETVRRFAALSGLFHPSEAFEVVPELLGQDADLVVAVASDLAAVCDTHAGGDGTMWLMRGPERRWQLDALSDGGSLENAIGWRRAAGTVPGDTADLLAALTGAPPFDQATLRGMIDDGARPRLQQAAVALDRAGRQAPASAELPHLRAALTRLDNTDRGDLLLGHGFVGRQDQLATIAAWLEFPVVRPPVTALFVGGLPGIGKSTLLEAAVRSVADRRWIVVRLDFDRAGLDVQDWVGLTIELARQVAAEIGEEIHDLQEARLTAASAASVSTVPLVKGQARERVPVALAQAVADQVRRVGRPILLVLDTLEVLRGRGETHPQRLFRWLDQLVDLGLAPMAVVAAGRGDALDSTRQRVERPIPLEGLDPEDVDLLLSRLGVSAADADAVRDVADGNPLVIRLAATVAEQVGATRLRKVVRRKDLAAAYLYRFLLFRIDDPALKELAYPGLVVRRISAEVIAEVLGPQLGHHRIDTRQAAALFEALSGQHWLVEPDPLAPGFVRHRPDVRKDLLRLLYESSPAKCARIDHAAAVWFARRPEPWCRGEAAYHRLQMMRRNPAIPPVDPLVVRQFDDQTVAELPPAARDVVRRARGERSSVGRDGTPAAGVDIEETTRELEALVGRADWAEAEHFYDRVLRHAIFDARSRTADAVGAFLWRSGRWTEAKRLLDERDEVAPGDRDLGDLSPVLASPRAEMRAELTPGRLLRSLAADPQLRAAFGALEGKDHAGQLDDGALGFLLQRAGVPRSRSTSQGYDAVGAVLETWTRESDPYAVQRSFGLAAERVSRRVSVPVAPPSGDGGAAAGPLGARLLAVLMPYAEVAVTSSRLRDKDDLAQHAEASYDRLARLGGLAPSGVSDWTLLPAYSEAVDGLADCGLLAEWLGAAAFVLRDADLGRIARSAERWRRTAAGQWAYGEVPAEWRVWRRPLDVTMADRVQRLLESDHPAAAGQRQLAAWSSAGDGDHSRLLEQIHRRLPGSLASARASAPDGAPRVAQVLLRSYVPSAFVPALTVLITNRQV